MDRRWSVADTGSAGFGHTHQNRRCSKNSTLPIGFRCTEKFKIGIFLKKIFQTNFSKIFRARIFYLEKKKWYLQFLKQLVGIQVFRRFWNWTTFSTFCQKLNWIGEIHPLLYPKIYVVLFSACGVFCGVLCYVSVMYSCVRGVRNGHNVENSKDAEFF